VPGSPADNAVGGSAWRLARRRSHDVWHFLGDLRLPYPIRAYSLARRNNGNALSPLSSQERHQYSDAQYATGRQSVGPVRSRTPLVLAGLLIVALIATVGLAAFAPGDSEGGSETTQAEVSALDYPISGRVASAVLALAVTPVQDAEIATTSTAASVDVMEADEASAGEPAPTAAPATTVNTEAPASSAAPSTTAAPPPAADTSPPALQIVAPDDGAIVTSRVVEFRGVTERGASVFSGPYEAEVDEDGNWFINLVVAPGDNGALFTARDAAGNEATARIVVTYDPPTTTTKPPSTTTTKPSTATTTTTKPSTVTTTTTQPPASQWSPLWPADSSGRRNVEEWRDEVAAHWDADKVDCVLGIIKLESGGDPTASNRGVYLGLLQHSSRYWESRARGAGFVDDNGLVASPFNGEANIAAGAYLAEYYERIGKDWRAPWTVWTSVPACTG